MKTLPETPVPTQIPLASPDITEEEIARVTEVLRSGVLSRGPQLLEFEQKMAHYCGADKACGVSGGTAGLHACVRALGIGRGDLVITSPFSFVASANAFLYEGAIPVFVDVDLETGNLDSAQTAELMEELAGVPAPPVRRCLPPALQEGACGPLAAVIPVHIFGQPADLDPILKLGRRHSIPVIEDACEAIGAEYKGRRVGAMGDAGVFAFYPNKQITTGEGGMVVTGRPELDAVIRSLCNQGRDEAGAGSLHTRLGYNYRMDEMSAALGLVQLGRIESLLARRRQVATWYAERLADCPDLKLPRPAATTTRISWFVYVVRVRNPLLRNPLMARLAERGIANRSYFTPIHLQPYYRKTFGFSRGCFPHAEYLSDVSLALPLSSRMKEDQVDFVCDNLRAALRSL